MLYTMAQLRLESGRLAEAEETYRRAMDIRVAGIGKGVSLSSYIQAVCGLRFLYTNTLHLQVGIDRIPLPRYEKKLPVILSQEEVKALLPLYPRSRRGKIGCVLRQPV